MRLPSSPSLALLITASTSSLLLLLTSSPVSHAKPLVGAYYYQDAHADTKTMTASASTSKSSGLDRSEWQKYGLQGYDPRRQRDPQLDSTIRPARSKEPWIDPALHGGSMLDLVNNGLREPINTIISGHSDPYVLTDAGLRDYVRSIGFSFECLDLHIGDLQRADLGDGSGWSTELFEYRSTQNFGAPGRWVGACWESFSGGNHFRAWKQNGSLADTGAWFLAVSEEKDWRHKHTIERDGYNQGRDVLVAAALAGGKFGSRLWKADVEWVDGLMPAGSEGINHDIAIDGRTAVLTIQRYWTIPPPGKGGRRFGNGGGLTHVGRALSDGLNKVLEWLKMRALV